LSVDPHWFESFFDTDEWVQIALTRDPERTEREVAFVASQLEPGARVLDLACGTGRIAVPLAARGFDVHGLDISERVLEVARRDAPGLDFRQGDMRELPWEDGSFDAVLNLWTAFGYFESQAEDERVLAEIARVLRPGGTLVLDTANQVALVRGFQREAWDDMEDGTLWLERRTYDLTTGRSQAFWSFVKDGRRRELAFDHRLYTLAEYGELLRRAGFTEIRFFGGGEEQEVTNDTFRVQIVARRA
jgi:ubiquinone/menaquinone biosynthesis C-methylase UbiE